MSTRSKYANRDQQTVQVADAGRVQAARAAGPHGSQTHTDGDSDASASAHRPTLRGVDGDDKGNGESYRPYKKGVLPGSGPEAPHFGSKEAAQGGFDAKEPQPAGEHDSSGHSFKSTRAPLPTPKSYRKK